MPSCTIDNATEIRLIMFALYGALKITNMSRRAPKIIEPLIAPRADLFNKLLGLRRTTNYISTEVFYHRIISLDSVRYLACEPLVFYLLQDN